MNDKFTMFWDTKVKPQAIICAKGYNLMCKIEREDIPEYDENNETLKELREMNIQDLTATWYIGQMIGSVEHDLADGRKGLGLLNSVMQVNETLSSKSYWVNVWENDFTSEEAQRLNKLGELMNELITYL